VKLHSELFWLVHFSPDEGKPHFHLKINGNIENPKVKTTLQFE
jgi:hypothetical protein